MIDEDRIRYILLSIIIILELTVIGFLVFDNDTKECISNNEVVPVLEEKEETNEEEIVPKIKVDIKGAVKKAGVYELDEGSRVSDQTTSNMIQRISRLFTINPLISKEI